MYTRQEVMSDALRILAPKEQRDLTPMMRQRHNICISCQFVRLTLSLGEYMFTFASSNTYSFPTIPSNAIKHPQ